MIFFSEGGEEDMWEMAESTFESSWRSEAMAKVVVVVVMVMVMDESKL